MTHVLLLGAANSIHLQRWANGLADAGVRITCASLHEALTDCWDERVQLLRLPGAAPLGYAAAAVALRRLMRQSGADLLHAHYASGYGVLATLAGCRPRLVSAWGSDVFEFPDRSPWHRFALERVLRSADGLASTSRAMADRMRKFVLASTPIAITPFGVDAERFRPDGATAVVRGGGEVRIGTVKTLAPVYGVDILLRAFARARCRAALRLRIVGDGPDTSALIDLAQALGVRDRVEFVGAVAHADVPAQLRALDVFVAASRHESFGVAVLEASACGVAVIASRVGGLPEVVVDGATGVLVDAEDVDALAAAIGALADDAAARVRLGVEGRRWVEQHYAWTASVQTMLALYRSLA